MKNPKVSIVILNWNQKEDTIECLNSLKGLRYSNYEIVLVDNGSNDGSQKEIIKLFPDVQLIKNPTNLGFTGGCNIGMKHALKNGSDYVFLLNNDTKVDKYVLQYLVNESEENKEVGIAGPAVYSYYKPNHLLSVGYHILIKKGETIPITNKTEINNPKEVDYIQGSALLIKRKVLTKVGLFYEPYFIYFEDVEMCLKAKKASYKVICVPTAKIWHKCSKSFGPMSPKAFYYYSRNRITFVMRNGNFADKLSFILYLPFVYTPLTVGYCLLHKKFDLIKSYLKGVFWHVRSK